MPTLTFPTVIGNELNNEVRLKNYDKISIGNNAYTLYKRGLVSLYHPMNNGLYDVIKDKDNMEMIYKYSLEYLKVK